jgi:hypothetical protein
MIQYEAGDGDRRIRVERLEEVLSRSGTSSRGSCGRPSASGLPGRGKDLAAAGADAATRDLDALANHLRIIHDPQLTPTPRRAPNGSAHRRTRSPRRNGDRNRDFDLDTSTSRSQAAQRHIPRTTAGATQTRGRAVGVLSQIGPRHGTSPSLAPNNPRHRSNCEDCERPRCHLE